MTDDLGYLTPEEKEALDRTAKLRFALMDEMTNRGTEMPTKSGDIRVLKELAESSDNAVLKRVELRQKADASDDNKKYLGMLEAILTQPREKTERHSLDEVTIPKDLTPKDIVPGEMTQNSEVLDIKDFVEDFEED